MIRFVVGPDGTVVGDIRANLPGRGVWITAERKRVEEAVGKNLFFRGFKKKVKVSPALATEVEMLLEKAALGSLGFARKAGECVTGATKVSAALANGKIAALLHAADASIEGLNKLAGAARAGHQGPSNSPQIPVFRCFSADQLGLALGGTNVIHAALTHGGAAKSCMRRIAFLQEYRGEAPPRNEDNDPVSGRIDKGAS